VTLHTTSIPRIELAHLPTPFEELEGLGEELGLRLYVKRDDCTGLAFGGNKTRKLEFTLGDALEKQADVLVTTGGLQSNHARQTAAAAATVGLGCHLVLENPLADPPAGYLDSGNRRLFELLGAVVHTAPLGETEARVAEVVAALRAEGHTPYVVPLGASDGIGSMGYALCARELLEDCEDASAHPSHVFLATGSAGTHAGLLLGLRLFEADVQVVGIAVSETAAAKRAKVRDVVARIEAVLGLEESPVDDDEIVVHDAYVGAGYGIPTEEADEAIRRLARCEGLLLDPVYTGKAMAGMLDLIATGALGELRDPVFLHTGGTPALFAYPGTE